MTTSIGVVVTVTSWTAFTLVTSSVSTDWGWAWNTMRRSCWERHGKHGWRWQCTCLHVQPIIQCSHLPNIYLQYITHRRSTHQLIATAEQHFSMTVLGKCFTAWKVKWEGRYYNLGWSVQLGRSVWRRWESRWGAGREACKRERRENLQPWSSVTCTCTQVHHLREAVKKRKVTSAETLSCRTLMRWAGHSSVGFTSASFMRLPLTAWLI